uniref:uncharacterized protein LOC105352945 n=1 Tax=Fragaria vesca subsp. vesca TaxID=101020 RepID=UPI0005C8172E|nr:PREDICTED: uncharacterized protein LOC105352945 [Fragaria vesca subsp. vesca]
MLGSEVAKVYSLNSQICKPKLPIVFDALKVIMVKPIEEGIEEADVEESVEKDMAHAAEAVRFLINTCIDESLIKQGVDHVLMNVNMYNRTNSEPTIIEKLCATIQSLFGYRGKTILFLALEIVSTMFDKLGVYSSCLMNGTLKTLADMQKLPDQEFPSKKEVKLVLQMVIEKWGLVDIMSVMPQEHMELLAERINELLDSKSVEARSNVSIATTVSNYLKREMDDDSDIEYEACNRVFKEQHARKVAKFTIAQRIQVQVR